MRSLLISTSRKVLAATALVCLEFLLLANIHVCFSSYTTEILRPRFEKAFTDRCTSEKYPFIERYYRNLENPNYRFVHFVFHEHGLHNGGFGDRISGLISATAIALRFNRTPLIESGNGFDRLFRPYHPNATFYTGEWYSRSITAFYVAFFPGIMVQEISN